MPDFKKQTMVNWFLPSSLLKVGLETALSFVFGRYADRREIQAALTTNARVFSYKEQEQLWFDYVADLGDGFDSTYTIATALAQESLTLDNIVLSRGRFLLMGGDEVYPSASTQNYNDRLKGPYKQALPKPAHPSEEDPHLYALPGNHDWYDGLTAFLRQFVQGRYIGGWRTQQQRSYFAIELPHDWWLFAIDIQLSVDLDWPQKVYFSECIKKLSTSNKVIIASAVPAWIEETLTGEKIAESLYYIESKIKATGAKVLVNLAGDLHHYAHYQNTERHRITCGGGGAFMHGTHHLPGHLSLDENVVESLESESTPSQSTYALNNNVFPSKKDSMVAVGKNIFFAFKNMTMAFTLGIYYLLLICSLQVKTIKDTPTWFDTLAAGGGGGAIFTMDLLQNMPALLLMVLMIAGMIAFYDPFPSRTVSMQLLQRWLIGGAHGFLHLMLAPLLAGFLFPYVYEPHYIAVFFTLGVYSLLAALVAGTVFGLYLLLSNLLCKAHADAALSSNRIADYKSFLRFHLHTNGDLTIYAIGFKQIISDWLLDKNDRYCSTQSITDKAHIIESFTIKG